MFSDSNEDHDLDRLSPRIIPPKENRTNYRLIARQRSPGSNGKIIDAWNEITESLENRAGSLCLDKFCDFILDKVVVVRLVVDDTLDVHSIFETVNHRGKYLAQIDLIRNHLYSYFNEESAEPLRKQIHENLERIRSTLVKGKKDNMSSYIRCVLQCEYGFLQQTQFFQQFKKRLSALGSRQNMARKVHEIIKDLREPKKIQIFKILLRNTFQEDFLDAIAFDAGANNERGMYSYLRDLRPYSITYPVIFALLCLYDRQSENAQSMRQTARFVYGACKMLASFMQRIAHTQGDFRPSHYEEGFATLAQKIKARRVKNTGEFLSALTSIKPDVKIADDAYYINAMSTVEYVSAEGNNNAKVKRIFEAIVECEKRKIVVKAQDSSVEYILPKSKRYHGENAWSEHIPEEQAAILCHRFGNLTLLEKRLKKPEKQFNSGYPEKLKAFAKSDYEITSGICKSQVWRRKDIEKRQSMLAKKCAEIWNFGDLEK